MIKIILKILTKARNSNFKWILNGDELLLFGSVEEKMDPHLYDDKNDLKNSITEILDSS